MSSGAGQATTAPPFLQGTFKTFPLANIFSVLALSRQLVRVRFSADGREVGSIAVKAGQVLGAEDFRTRTRGADALRGLISDPGTEFSVVKLPRNAPESQTTAVIGKLAELHPKIGGEQSAAEEEPTAEPLPVELSDSVTPDDISGDPEKLAAALIGEPGAPLAEPSGGPEKDSIRPSSPSALSSDTGEVILRGNVSDVSFEEILEVLQLNQQHLLISFIRGGAQIGTLNLMSEQVLAAARGPLRGVEAIRGLYADHGETFEVRRLPALDVTEPLGGVSELLADARQAQASAAEGERSLFMEGRLSDFPLELLIGSLDLSRQPIELVLRREENVLHRVLIKSGRIITAASTFGEGVDAALAAIRGDPGVEFLVYGWKGPIDEPPVARLRALVSETDDVGDAPEAWLAPSGDPLRREAEGRRLAGIEARLEQIAGDMTALRLALKISDEDSVQAGEIHALLQSSAAEPELLLGQEHARERATQELRTVLATLGPGRRERTLLWCTLALQFGTLAVAIALLVLVL